MAKQFEGGLEKLILIVRLVNNLFKAYLINDDLCACLPANFSLKDNFY